MRLVAITASSESMNAVQSPDVLLMTLFASLLERNKGSAMFPLEPLSTRTVVRELLWLQMFHLKEPGTSSELPPTESIVSNRC